MSPLAALPHHQLSAKHRSGLKTKAGLPSPGRPRSCSSQQGPVKPSSSTVGKLLCWAQLTPSPKKKQASKGLISSVCLLAICLVSSASEHAVGKGDEQLHGPRTTENRAQQGNPPCLALTSTRTCFFSYRCI